MTNVQATIQYNQYRSGITVDIVTFRVSCRRREMCSGHTHLSVCLCLSVAMPTVLHGPGCNLGSSRGCPLVVQYWADLQSVKGLRCYGNIPVMRTQSVGAYS